MTRPRVTGANEAFGPIAAAFIALGAVSAFIASRMLRLAEGHLVYALDDAYIHMAIAKNLAAHGVWGVQPDSFSASSSSPLWTVLLAVTFRLFGVLIFMPLVLNAVFAVCCVLLIARILEREGITGVPMFALLLATSLLGPLVPLVWTGMEHSLHIVLTLATVWRANTLIRSYTRRRLATTAGLAALMVSARYEGLFVVAGLGLMLALHGRFLAGIAVGAAGAVPIATIGLWNVSHGWFFLPASILMKQTALGQTGSSLLEPVVENVVHTAAPAAFFALLIVGLLLLGVQMRTAGSRSLYPPLVVFAVAATFHLAFAKFGYLWRYESYLMVLGALSTAIALQHVLLASRTSSRTTNEVLGAAALVVVVIFSTRTIGSSAVVANTAGHIYRQHEQVARFLGRYYDREPVALNDIGAVSYFTRVRVRDLMGLGSLDMARLRRAGSWDATHINALLREDHTSVAVIYDYWFFGDRAFQRTWHRVGEWVTDAEDKPTEGTVTFFAVDDGAAETLRGALREFNTMLPASEVATHIYDPEPPNR